MIQRTTLVVCEDGDEYHTRFARLLGQEIDFVCASCYSEALHLLRGGAAGILLDLDFRRTDPAQLIDESGACHATLADGERHRLAPVQGILILRALRSAGITAPAILFADLDDPSQAAYLGKTLSPLLVLASNQSLPTIARHIRAMGAQP